MPLTVQQIKEILQEKPGSGRSQIQPASDHEGRVRFHSQTSLGKGDIERPFSNFMAFVGSLLSDDKYNMFLSLMRFPVATVPLSDEIYQLLHKVFDGRNPVFNYEFISDNSKEDFLRYLEGRSFLESWSTLGFEMMKTAINSVVIVDLPEEESTDPEPYYYFLPISDVLDYEPEEDGFEWIIFKPEKDRIAVFDNEFYRVFSSDGKEVKEMLIESAHGLGYCPARFFWTTPINTTSHGVKRSPISNFLGKLDLLLFFEVSNEHLNLYGRYPIYSAFATDCDYENNEAGHYCDGGHLRTREGLYIIQGDSPAACPVCSKNRIIGPGTYIEIDPPGRSNNNADLRNPVQSMGIDKDALEYNINDIERRKKEIFTAVTGYKGSPVTDQAVNEKQVTAVFESMESALQGVQMNFEKIIEWTAATIARLQHGESFVSASVSLGTEHYLLTGSQIMQLYNFAKESSFSPAVLDMLEKRYYETEFRNNPERLRRQITISHLTPFRHLTIDQVKSMYDGGQIKYDDFIIKMNFSAFLSRFERENMPLAEFASNVSLEKKIAAVRAEFERYAEEMKPGGESEESSSVTDLLNAYSVAVRSGAVTPPKG